MLSPLNIRDALITYWNTNYTETPTAYQNSEFPAEDKKSPFISFSINFVDSETVYKGSGTQTRYSGVILAMIRVPVMSGTRRAYELADIAATILERKRLDGGSITTYASEIGRQGEVDEYYTLPVTVPFVVT